MLLLDGAEHLRHRRLMLPPFHGERMRAYEAVMQEAADRAIDSWPVGEPFTLLPSDAVLTLEVIMRAVFGMERGTAAGGAASAGPRDARAGRHSSGLSMLILLAGGRARRRRAAMQRFEAQRRAVDELIYEEIARRREVSDLEERDDVFSMLLLARDEDGEALSDAELRDELVTLLVAGHETTSTGLAWAFELLLRNPRVLERCAPRRGRRRATSTRSSRRPCACGRSIAGVGRVVRGEPFELGGYAIPPGVEINPSIAAIHRRADCYPDPRGVPARALPRRRTRPTPTPGCPSAAGPGAAWAPASPRSRCRS